MVLSHPDRLSGIARARTAPSLDRDESPDRPGRALSARPPRRGEPPFGGRSVVALHCSVRAVPRRPLAVPALETHLRRRNLAVGPGGPDLAAQRPTMISRRFDMSILATRVRALGRTCVFLSALCAAAAIAQAPVQPPASPKPAEAAGPAGPAAAAIAAQGPQPPDGVWLKDPDGLGGHPPPRARRRVEIIIQGLPADGSGHTGADKAAGAFRGPARRGGK